MGGIGRQPILRLGHLSGNMIRLKSIWGFIIQGMGQKLYPISGRWTVAYNFGSMNLPAGPAFSQTAQLVSVRFGSEAELALRRRETAWSITPARIEGSVLEGPWWPKKLKVFARAWIFLIFDSWTRVLLTRFAVLRCVIWHFCAWPVKTPGSSLIH